MPDQPTVPPDHPERPPRSPLSGAWDRFGILAADVGLAPRTAALWLGALVLVVAVLWLWRASDDAEAEPDLPFAPGAAPEASGGAPAEIPTGSLPIDEPVVVHAAGAVRRPGLYELPAGSRVADLIAAAGGAGGRADTDGVNLAAPLVDGEQVVVPRRGEVAVAPPVGGSGGGAEPASTVNINTADVAALQALSGVGPVTAAAIVEHREINGPFGTVEDLIDVAGIGEITLDGLRDSVTV